jgi:hypothetical protein
MAYLTAEEHQRVEYLLPIVEALVRRMGADGVGDPIATLRAAVDAGPDASEAPILALARQVAPEALRWAPDLRLLLVIHDHADVVRLRDVLHRCLDRIALGEPRGGA